MSDRITRRELLKKGLGTAVSVGVLSTLPDIRPLFADNIRRPNIVYVLADMMRYTAMGCGVNNQVRTPNLERLAAEGVFFSNAFSGYPICTPYRAMFLTGRYCHTTGVLTNDYQLPLSEITIAEQLKQHGYNTALIGKWHLDGHRNPYVPKENRQGFDYWVTENCKHTYWDTPTCFGDETVARPLLGYQPDAQTDLAIKYIREQSRCTPFFLFLSFGPPHNPYLTTEQFTKWYNPAEIIQPPNVPTGDDHREVLGRHYGQISNLDYNLGRIIKALEDAGMADDTILVFTSDHGNMLGSHGEGIAKKERPWDESVHIPFIVRYPRKAATGLRTDVLFNSVDVMPTLLALAGVPVPSAVQGTDFSSFVQGQGGTEYESVFMQEIQPTGSSGVVPWRAVRTKRYTYARKWGEPWLLYDDQVDPYQMNNLINKPEVQQIQAHMQLQLQYWLQRTGDTFA